jgi:hypothetical protein
MNKNTNSKRGLMALFLAFIFVGSMLSGCNSNTKKEEKKAGFQLTGTIHGFTGALKVSSDYGEKELGTVDVKDGKITFSHDFPVPTVIEFQTEDRSVFISFWAENAKMTLDAKKVTTQYGDRYEAVVTGGEMQAGADHFRKASKEYGKTHPSEMSFSTKIYAAKTDAERKKLEEQKKQAKLDYLDFQKNYIKENPTNPYCAQLVWVRLTSKTGGESAVALKKWADPIAMETRKHPFVAKMFRMLNSMLETEAGLEKFVANAKNVSYKVDKSYKGEAHKNIAYLSIFKDNNLCALCTTSDLHSKRMARGEEKAKTKTFVQIINPQGKELSRFEVAEEGSPSTLAVDDQNNIYVCVGKTKEKINKFRGKTSKYQAPAGVKCLVYSKDGKLQKEFMLEGVKQASGSRIFEDKLLVSDVGSQLMQIYNKEDGTPVSKLGDLRPCCSILDFDVDKKGNIIVANLGSFRVDAYDFSGKKLVSFGQRGKGINDFWSCCNPVSVRKLDNNCVITVEKTPTRIKVYSKDGAHPIDGIEDLVQGCFHIPVMSDSNSNIYLASPEKGLVKCVAS